MNPKLSNVLRDSCKSVLLPLVTFFLKRGFRYQEFSQLLKEALVESCDKTAESYSSKNISTSKISQLTGLPRKQVADLRGKMRLAKFQGEDSVPAGVVLKKWFNASELCGLDGRPENLAYDAPSDGADFVRLVRSVDDEVSPRAILKELTEAGAVTIEEDGRISVSARTYIISSRDETVIRYFGIAGSNLLSTLLFNTECDRNAKPYFERTAWASDISAATFQRFSALVNETSKPFLELADDWLNSHQQSGIDHTESEKSVIGVGIYVFNRKSKDNM